MGFESFDDAVANAYREVVAENGDDPIKKQEAFGIASERIAQLVLDGVVEVPADRAILAALEAADQQDGKSVDRTLTLLSSGYDALDFEDDPMLDRVAVLGTGLRKSFRHITIEDFRVMDSLRYQNLRSAQEAYHRWRVQFDAWQPCIERHRTMGNAVAAGDVPEFEQ